MTVAICHAFSAGPLACSGPAIQRRGFGVMHATMAYHRNNRIIFWVTGPRADASICVIVR